MDVISDVTLWNAVEFAFFSLDVEDIDSFHMDNKSNRSPILPPMEQVVKFDPTSIMNARRYGVAKGGGEVGRDRGIQSGGVRRGYGEARRDGQSEGARGGGGYVGGRGGGLSRGVRGSEGYGGDRGGGLSGRGRGGGSYSGGSGGGDAQTEASQMEAAQVEAA